MTRHWICTTVLMGFAVTVDGGLTLAQSTWRVSVDSAGVQGDQDSEGLSISEDGRLMAFEGDASNLVPGDTNGVDDIFVHGSDLILEASPETVPVGATLILTTWTGQPSGRALLAAVEVDGTPAFTTLSVGGFGPLGLWTVSGTVPPVLAGHVVTFQGFGIAPNGKACSTNPEAVTMQ